MFSHFDIREIVVNVFLTLKFSPFYSYNEAFTVRISLISFDIWAASSEFGTNRLCEQRRFRRDCASAAQSHQNLRCSLIQAMNQEEPSDRKPDPWPLWMAGHAQLNVFMTECSKTQIRLTRPIWCFSRFSVIKFSVCLPYVEHLQKVIYFW